ncbi:multi-sensor signal transduction histidine kinase [Methanofollis liminatans DSM 4140]|uniref:histidine kinase n=1 Tax=Methanofollis liminatans DSM 4140 TaxID=28892 RepID=J1L467_9EURY|nr:PAS domain S-box protein [Methanofollis liminatans]EJG07540.1 multi-sensor signal transduction histidine kinase [Methanofollis liminatans DSM 4140]
MISVLYVDDDPDTRGRVKFFLEAGGEVSVLTADSADGAHVLLVDQRFDVIVSDYQMSGTDGIAFLKQIRAAGNEIPFILFAERSREEAVIEAFNSGAQFYLLKEGDQEECFSTLSLRIRQAVRRRGGHEDLENSLPLPFFEIDIKGNILRMNRAAHEAFLYSREDIERGVHHLQLILPRERVRACRDIETVISRDLPHSQSNYIFQRKDGSSFPGTLYVNPVLQDGNTICIRGLIVDLTVQMENEALLRTLIHSMPDLFCFKDGEGRWIETNERSLTFLRIEGLDYKGLTDDEIAEYSSFYRKILVQSGESDSRAWQSAGGLREDQTFVGPDGCERTFDIIRTPIFKDDGSRSGLVIIARDITEKKKAEEELIKGRQLLRAIIDNNPAWIACVDRDGRYLLANRNFCETFNLTTSEIVGMDGRDLLPPHILERHMPLVEACLNGETVHFADESPDWVKGPKYDIGSYTPITGSDGRVAGVVLMVNDVTELKRTETALSQANRKLNLLSSITRHDILNSLHVLYGYLDLASTSGDEGEKTVFIGKAIEQVKKIRSEIDFTRDYQDLGVHAPEWQEPQKLLEQAWQFIASGNVTLHADLEGVAVYADPMLGKVISNLIDNALRHGGAVTSITASFRLTPDGLIWSVEDDGVGLSEDMKERIFLKGVGKNTGYGLFLAREILGITEISIRETGTSGKGARFEILVPPGRYLCSVESCVRADRTR